ncbi:MAG: hypothetical protein IPG68_13320 [Micrococcales bacterium]|nr:hypothetical protein [Micrococcales bacterium]
MPALRRPLPAVAVVVDTSGSIDDGLLAQALGEVKSVLASLAVPDSSVTVLAVDAAVHTVQQVRDVRGAADWRWWHRHGRGDRGGVRSPAGPADGHCAHRRHPVADDARTGAGDRGRAGPAPRPVAPDAGLGAAGGSSARWVTCPDLSL